MLRVFNSKRDDESSEKQERQKKKKKRPMGLNSSEHCNFHRLRGWFTAELMSEVRAAAVEEMDVFDMSYNKAQGREF